ncbi:MAG: hypothetical protein AAGU75_16930, partial [Bacillota bacterium]
MYFLERDYIAGIECYLDYYENPKNIGRAIFTTDEVIWRMISKINITKFEEDTYEEFLLNNREDIHWYMKEHFFLLVEVIQERLAITDKTKAVFVTFLLINRMLPSYFSNKWRVDFGSYFQNISHLSLSEAVDTFCSIDPIDHHNDTQQGAFVYFLI